MAELKSIREEEGAGYLYRSSYALAAGNVKQAILFFRVASEKIPALLETDLTDFPSDKRLKETSAVWAEKMLDEYIRRMRMLKRR